MDDKNDTVNIVKDEPRRNKFNWKNFDLDKFFKDTEKVGEIIKERDSSKNAE